MHQLIATISLLKLSEKYITKICYSDKGGKCMSLIKVEAKISKYDETLLKVMIEVIYIQHIQ